MSSRPLSLPESRRSFPRSRRRGAASGASWREELQIHNFSTMCPWSHRVLLTSPERRVGVFHSQPDEWAEKAWGLQKPPLPGEPLCATGHPHLFHSSWPSCGSKHPPFHSPTTQTLFLSGTPKSVSSRAPEWLAEERTGQFLSGRHTPPTSGLRLLGRVVQRPSGYPLVWPQRWPQS